jgi:hypothetical protein
MDLLLCAASYDFLLYYFDCVLPCSRFRNFQISYVIYLFILRLYFPLAHAFRTCIFTQRLKTYFTCSIHWLVIIIGILFAAVGSLCTLFFVLGS